MVKIKLQYKESHWSQNIEQKKSTWSHIRKSRDQSASARGVHGEKYLQ